MNWSVRGRLSFTAHDGQPSRRRRLPPPVRSPAHITSHIPRSAIPKSMQTRWLAQVGGWLKPRRRYTRECRLAAGTERLVRQISKVGKIHRPAYLKLVGSRNLPTYEVPSSSHTPCSATRESEPAPSAVPQSFVDNALFQYRVPTRLPSSPIRICRVCACVTVCSSIRV